MPQQLDKPILLTYEGKTNNLESGETVLECLERHGHSVASSCRAGACQFCMVKLTAGEVPNQATKGIPEELKNSGHFLSCVCIPEGDISCVAANTADFVGETRILALDLIGPEILRVRLNRPAQFSFKAGQFVTLTNDTNISRSYSIASQSHNQDFFDIHIKRIHEGRMSTWFHEQATAGELLRFEGPKGECTYKAENKDESLVLVGTGTGIAPLVAIAINALEQGHRGAIQLYQGALTERQLYLENELEEFTRIYPNFSYLRCTLESSARADIFCGDIKEIALSKAKDLPSKRIYLCGDPGLVQTLKKSFFLDGVSLHKIHSDPFIIASH